ncbi:phosphoribosyltransferase [Plantactinospora sp. S1510]|uniref:Phosphoribosyltransferase n=1 Tax=Plantactinospora alkalitolerans TaxID=2789879 RepID=A0ABS0H1G1_9ACTN|nr:phosphoribosyltransferase [Plantactinospora alkalitolerans]MBF9131967.1 phosphoribosyltransferase [Plantactinospora alkalitolerans]
MTDESALENATPENPKRLVLLQDFPHWIESMEIPLPRVTAHVFDAVRAAAVDCYASVVSTQALDLPLLRDLTGSRRRQDEYLVTLDNGSYFPHADFAFSVTRCAAGLRDVFTGNLSSQPRDHALPLHRQLESLRLDYLASRKPRLVLCDDGISTGASLAGFVRRLRQADLAVSEIRVLLNPTPVFEIEGIPVDTMVEVHDALWTHERDFFWGSPGGGVPLVVAAGSRQYGVPYSISSGLLHQRLGLPLDVVAPLRARMAAVNIAFWNLLSRLVGRALLIRDCYRLHWTARFFGVPYDTRIVDVIARSVDRDRSS